jgi:hypothetical protein
METVVLLFISMVFQFVISTLLCVYVRNAHSRIDRLMEEDDGEIV